MAIDATSLEEFHSWFVGQGGYIHPSTELAHDTTRGVHLRVKQNSGNGVKDARNEAITQGTVVISCLHSSSLSALNARGYPPVFPAHPVGGPQNKQIELPPQFLEEARPQCVAAVVLCAQYHNRHTSWWKEYFRILPPSPVHHGHDPDARSGGQGQSLWELDSPLWWQEDELAFIKGTNLEKGMHDLRAAWIMEWEQWKPDILSWTQKHGWSMVWDDFQWAMTILGSRAFSSSQISSVMFPTDGQSILNHYNPDALLYPGVDCLNHNPLSRNHWFSDSERFGIVCNDTPGPGEEVWNHYGGKSNSELLLSYGFCPLNNPNDTFALKLAQSPPSILLQTSISSVTNTTSAISTHTATTAHLPPMAPHSKPPAFSIPHNIYFVRTLNRLTAAADSDAVLDPNYPAPTSSLQYLDICAFPHLLLLTLSYTIANASERAAIDATAGVTPANLWSGLRSRNLSAVRALLYARLTMELARLERLFLRSSDSIIKTCSSYSCDKRMRRDMARHERRLAYTQTYLTGQQTILHDTTQFLEEALLLSLGAFPSSSFIVTDSPAAVTSATGQEIEDFSLVTLSHVIHILKSFDPVIEAAFRMALLTLYGTSSVGTIRTEFDGEEENVWVMLLVVLVTTFADGGVVVEVDREAEAESLIAKSRAERQAQQWLQHLESAGYGILAAAATAATTISIAPGTALDGKESDENDVDLTNQIIARVNAMYDATSEGEIGREIFTPDRWPSALIRACIHAVMEENVRISFRPTAYSILRTYERVLEVAGGAGETNYEEEEGDHNDGEKHAEIDVVCLHLGEQ